MRKEQNCHALASEKHLVQDENIFWEGDRV